MITFEKRAKATSTEELHDDALIELAENLSRQGFAPPSRIYQVEYRRRIDWSRFPSWARPVNPEDFDGCCHEG